MRRGTMTVGTVLILLGVVFCCGCTEEPMGGGDLTGTVWMLESYMNMDGSMTESLATAPVTAEFADGSVGGTSGCNTYTAAYVTDGQSLTVEMPVVTMMYCGESGVMDQESRYLSLLRTAAGYMVSGDQLTITDSSGQEILVYRAVNQNLGGTEWMLTGYNNGAGGFVSVLTGTAVTAAFSEDGQISGTAGCNSYSGAYVVTGSAISIGPLAMTEMYCMDPEGVMAQESAYLAAVQAAASFRVGPGDLTITDADGTRMAVYKRYTPAPQGEDWEVTGYNNGQGGVISPLVGTTITAVFGEDGQVTGSAGCNNYFASYSVSGMELTIGPVGSTRMSCETPEGVMEQESQYLALLGDVSTFERAPETLTLRDEDGSILVTYAIAQPKLTAGEWQMVSYRDAGGNTVSALAGTDVTAVFGEDGQVTGKSGCNSYFGSYTTDGPTISIGPLGMTMMYCETPVGVMDQESGYLAALEQAVSYRMSGNELTLHTEDDSTCVRFMQEV
ncbi:META domain-containing protein [Methanogenium organophilum]|uniref:META domain-containing protein n=1 Tax=Methanogenium organophilum TaxID=2199 RepID=A0A9X9S597_METOG|nr:META domain-containing protein [Methanogenium organophilum]WAI01921.1 META domain-containing protein [Methanogenium organophilum]